MYCVYSLPLLGIPVPRLSKYGFDFEWYSFTGAILKVFNHLERAANIMFIIKHLLKVINMKTSVSNQRSASKLNLAKEVVFI